MPLLTPAETLRLKAKIVETFGNEQWLELGVLTGCADLINRHPRLLRSLSWNDAGNVLEVITSIIDRNPSNAEILRSYVVSGLGNVQNISSKTQPGPAIVFQPAVFEIPEQPIDPNLVAVMMPFDKSFDPHRGGNTVAQPLSYRVAVSGDEDAILKVFEEVAPEVPTVVNSGTKGIVQDLVASELSWVAVDANSKIVGYALAKPHDQETLSLWYLGVSKAARNQHASSILISKLKEIGAPIITDVRHNNASSMVERFEHLGFVKCADGILGKDQTKLRWKMSATEENLLA